MISRILCLDIYLSRSKITLWLEHEPSAEAEPTHLHHLGFAKTFRLLECLSARKRTAETFHLGTMNEFFSRIIIALLSLCGTFHTVWSPIQLEPLALRLGNTPLRCPDFPLYRRDRAYVSFWHSDTMKFLYFAKFLAQWCKFSPPVLVSSNVSYRAHMLNLVSQVGHHHVSYLDGLEQWFVRALPPL